MVQFGIPLETARVVGGIDKASDSERWQEREVEGDK